MKSLLINAAILLMSLTGYSEPLHLLVLNCDYDQVEKNLSSKEVSLDDTVEPMGQPLLILSPDAKMTEILLRAGADPKVRSYQQGTALMAAAINGSTEQMKLLIENGNNPNAKDKWGRTALHYCVGNMSPESVDLLLSNGVYIDVQDHEGRTPLMRAVLESDKSFIAKILAGKASLHIVDKDNKTALDLVDSSYDDDPSCRMEIRNMLMAKY